MALIVQKVLDAAGLNLKAIKAILFMFCVFYHIGETAI